MCNQVLFANNESEFRLNKSLFTKLTLNSPPQKLSRLWWKLFLFSLDLSLGTHSHFGLHTSVLPKTARGSSPGCQNKLVMGPWKNEWKVQRSDREKAYLLPLPKKKGIYILAVFTSAVWHDPWSMRPCHLRMSHPFGRRKAFPIQQTHARGKYEQRAP